jgi:hypothetical protein
MRAVMRGAWHVGLIAGVCIAVVGCAALDRTTETVVTPVKYAWAGVDSGLRTNLQHGLTQLEAADIPGAVRSLNRAIWDLQRIEDRGLRMGELARAHRAMGDAYSSVRKPDWAEDQWRLAAAFAARSRQAAVPGDGPSPLDLPIVAFGQHANIHAEPLLHRRSSRRLSRADFDRARSPGTWTVRRDSQMRPAG